MPGDKQYDLSGFSRMLGDLINPYEHERVHQASVRDELVKRADERHVVLKPSDIVFVDGEPTIDGMPAGEWLDAMTEE